MNNLTQPSIGERSEIVRFFRWLFSWRGIRRILIVLELAEGLGYGWEIGAFPPGRLLAAQEAFVTNSLS
jgi:hypothetical protein